MSLDPIGFATATAVGLVMGSYAITTGLRHARAEGAVLGRSRCDQCGAGLGLGQTIPVVSFLRQRGACRWCQAPIDPIHLAGELVGASVVVSAFWCADPWRAPVLAALGLILVAACAVDTKIQRLPDLYTALAAACSMLLAAEKGFDRFCEGLVAAVVTVSVLLAIRQIGTRSRDEPGLGMGDVKLVAGLALWLGAAVPLMITLAAAMGLVVTVIWRRGSARTAFGPMISAAAWLVGIGSERGWMAWVR